MSGFDWMRWLLYRKEGALVLSGGLTAHNLGDRTSFSPVTARPAHKEFDAAIHTAINVKDVSAEKLKERKNDINLVCPG
jgi:aromatic ring-opening dioxygenase catalytic subunit (LigB family)